MANKRNEQKEISTPVDVNEIEDVKSEEGSKENIPDGIIVTVSEQGNFEVKVLGNTKPTEAPTLLRLAAKHVDSQLGI